MPRDREPAGETDYYHRSFTDFRSVAQDLGSEGEGNVPDTNPRAFPTV